MEIITGYTGTPHVTAAQDGALNAGAIGADCYALSVGNALAGGMVSTTEFRVMDGVLVMYGRAAIIPVGTYDSLAVSPGTQGMKRKDLVVAHFQRVSAVESIALEVIEGTPSASPVDPSYQSGNIYNGDGNVQVPLFRINVDGITIAGVDRLIPTLDSIASLTDKTAQLGNFATVYSSISGQTGQGFRITGNTTGLLVVTGPNAALNGLYLVHRSGSAITHTPVLAASSITITPDGNNNDHVAVFNSGAVSCRATYVVFLGSVSIG